MLHVLWECGVAQDVWAKSQVQLQKSVSSRADILQLVKDLTNRLTAEDLGLFPIQCWIIWNQRNSVLHDGTLLDPTQLNKRAMNFLEEYKGAQDQLAIPTIIGLVQTWTPPLGLVYKLNFDAAVFANINALGFGAVVCNEKGEVMAALSAKGPPVLNSEEAEVLACWKAMKIALDAGFMEQVLEGYNINIMKSISSPGANRSRLGHIYKDVQCIAAGFRGLSVSFVKRSANFVAHSLAKYASQLDNQLVWLEESPPLALKALYFDFRCFNE